MTFLDIDKLTPEDLIVHYVLECRGSGHFLPYIDYQVIEEWLAASRDADDLLVILSDVLPRFYARDARADGSKPKPLTGARKLVLSRLKDRAMR
jgi:hypothetical protein